LLQEFSASHSSSIHFSLSQIAITELFLSFVSFRDTNQFSQVSVFLALSSSLLSIFSLKSAFLEAFLKALPFDLGWSKVLSSYHVVF
jgi:hypothetical protein